MTANTVNNFPLRPMKTPFAGTALISANTSSVGGINVSTLPATGDNVANVATGFPETFSTSITKGGKYIKRADVNAMGYIATIMAFRQQMGMPNEWNKQICDAIGGYPKGAVLDYCIWNGSVIQETYKITSLTDDNTEDPTTTAQANWKQWARVSVNAEYARSIAPETFPILKSTSSVTLNYIGHSCSASSSEKQYETVYSNGLLTINVSNDADLRYCKAYLKGHWTYIGKACGRWDSYAGATTWTFLCEKGLKVSAGYSGAVNMNEGDHAISFSELKVS